MLQKRERKWDHDGRKDKEDSTGLSIWSQEE